MGVPHPGQKPSINIIALLNIGKPQGGLFLETALEYKVQQSQNITAFQL